MNECCIFKVELRIFIADIYPFSAVFQLWKVVSLTLRIYCNFNMDNLWFYVDTTLARWRLWMLEWVVMFQCSLSVELWLFISLTVIPIILNVTLHTGWNWFLSATRFCIYLCINNDGCKVCVLSNYKTLKNMEWIFFIVYLWSMRVNRVSNTYLFRRWSDRNECGIYFQFVLWLRCPSRKFFCI